MLLYLLLHSLSNGLTLDILLLGQIHPVPGGWILLDMQSFGGVVFEVSSGVIDDKMPLRHPQRLLGLLRLQLNLDHSGAGNNGRLHNSTLALA